MTCEECEASVHEYLRGTLAEPRQSASEKHFAECARCGDLLARLLELRCRDFVDFLNDYLDGELGAERRSVFERHLSLCPDCRTYVDTYRQTMELSVSSLGDQAPLAEEIPESLVEAILAARK